jgi:hypothetical protein
MGRKPSIKAALELSKYFWPDFKEEDGFILLAWEHPFALSPERGLDYTGVEALCNHTHMIDLFFHNAELSSESEEDGFLLDYNHSDFVALCEVAKRMAQIWFLKLQQDFPQYQFRVYYTERENPIVRFHRVRENEPYWLDEENWPDEVKLDRIIVYDSQKK